jgi:hypothetical protein
MGGPRPTETPSLTPAEIEQVLQESLGDEADQELLLTLLPLLTLAMAAGALWVANAIELPEPTVTAESARVQRFRRARAGMVATINETTRTRLRRKLLAAAEETEAEALRAAARSGLSEVFQSAIRNRSPFIALSETATWWDTGEYMQEEEADVPGRDWFTMRDPKVRESHQMMEGQCQPLGEAFRSGLGNYLMYPHDPSAPLADTANCRCVCIPRPAGCGKAVMAYAQKAAYWKANMASRRPYEQRVQKACRRLFSGQQDRAARALEKALRF